MDNDDRYLAYVLLVTRDGKLHLADDKIYADLGQPRELVAAQQREANDAGVRYSIGVIVPLEDARRLY
jgi:hypothetical protein